MNFYVNNFFLKRVIKISKYIFLSFVIFIAQGALVHAQQVAGRLITGKVTDDSGLPLPGVSVNIKGSSNGTSTNKDGNYSLSIPEEGKTLLFSYIGFTPQEKSIPAGLNVINVALVAQDSNLDEVVVVGYGTQKKSTVTGSVVAIKGSDLTNIPSPNISNSLVGRLPGLVAVSRGGAPGADASSINIRGFGTPLILVNGIEVASYDNLNPNDIENISVLKDASASIYGARAANGVILITTKKGVIGKDQISFDTSFGLQSPTVTPKFVDSKGFLNMLNVAYENAGTPNLMTPQSEIDKYGKGDPAYPNTDWYGETFKKNAPLYRYDLSLRGGTEKVKYFISMDYQNEGGLFRTNDFNSNRYNFRANLDVQVSKDFDISLDLSGLRSQQNQSSTPIFNIQQLVYLTWPTKPASFPDPNMQASGTNNGRTSNPLSYANKDIAGYNQAIETSIVPTVNLNYNISAVKGLSAKAVFNFRYDVNHNTTFQKNFNWYDYSWDSGDYTLRGSQQSTWNESFGDNYNLWPQFSLNYDNTFGGKHHFTGLLLYELYPRGSQSLSASRTNFISNQIENISVGSPNTQINNGNRTWDGRAAYVSRINYDYDQKYLVELIGREDASSKFAPNVRWGFFPAISLGWKMSSEDFLKKFSAIDNLKIRASIGKAGTDPSTIPQYIDGFNNSTGYVFGDSQTLTPGIDFSAIANTNFTWIESTTSNIGVDFSFWKKQLYGSADVFKRSVKGDPSTRAQGLPDSFGATLGLENLNSFSDRGIELVLGHQGQISDFTYGIEANFSYTRSKWGHYEEPVFANEQDRQRLQNSGQWKNRFFGYQAAGLFQTQGEVDAWPVDQDGQNNATIRPGDIKYLDQNGDGVLSDKDQVVIGKGDVPDVIFGLKLDASYKNFTFSMLWQGATQVNTMFASDAIRPLFDFSVPLQYMTDYWTPDNPNARFPRLAGPGGANNNYLTSSYWLYDASYVRLKSIEIGYNLPKSLLSKIGVQQLRVYVAGQNLLTFDNVYPFDPETQSGERGYYYPQQKAVNLGVNLVF